MTSTIVTAFTCLFAIIGLIIGGMAGLLWGSILGLILGLIWGLPNTKKTPEPTSAESSPTTAQDCALPLDPPKCPSLSKGGLRWVPPNSVIETHGYRITSGLIYVCDDHPDPDEASAINLRLPVDFLTIGDESSLCYFNQYKYLSPSNRRAYLEWQAKGRKDEDPATRDLKQVFLFYFGIERHLLVDNGKEPEAIQELVRLLTLYGRTRSLRSYICQLIHFWGWRQGPEYYEQLRNWMDTLPVALLGQDELAIVLASLYLSGKPLKSALAYEVVVQTPDVQLSELARRNEKNLKPRFIQRYIEEFPNGLNLQATSGSIALKYRPANPSLLDLIDKNPAMFQLIIPDVMGVSSQFAPLRRIWDACINDVSKTDRIVIRVNVPTKQALRSVSPEISPNPTLSSQWDILLKTARRANSCSLIKAGEAAQLLGINPRRNLTLRQSQKVAEMIESLGLCVEPDAKSSGTTYGWDDDLGVFSPSNKTVIPPSDKLRGAKTLFELCVFIATADGFVSPEELEASRKFIETHCPLAPEELERLNAFQATLVCNPTKAKVLFANIERHISTKDRERIGHLLVLIAMTDNVITKDELRCLERAYKELGLSIESLNEVLKSFQPEAGESVNLQLHPTVSDEVVVQVSQPTVIGELIGQPPKQETCEKPPVRLTINEAPKASEIQPRKIETSIKPGRPSGFILDMSRVAAISKETNEIIGILSQVMAEEDETGVKPQSTNPVDPFPASAIIQDNMISDSAWLAELNVKYQPLVHKIIVQETWSRAEFDALAKSFKLMPLDAIDSINEWSDEKLGDFLLDGNDPVKVNKSLLLKGDPTNARN